MYQREITDDEFLNSFQSFAFAARPAISHLLCEKLRDDETLKENDVKAILLHTIENYYFQTEMVLMLIKAFNEKKLNSGRSLAAIFNGLSIKEGKKENNSGILLTQIQNWSNQQFVNYMGLKDPSEIIKNLSDDKIQELEDIFGTVDNAKAQGLVEISNLKNSLESLIANRIEQKDGTKIPFYKMLNKLKHGYQVVEDNSENVLSILIDLKETTSNWECK